MCKDKKTTYLLSGGTAAPIRHLLRVHKIEPTISPSSGSISGRGSGSRKRGHGKHRSESSITLSAHANASLYKGELLHPGLMPPGAVAMPMMPMGGFAGMHLQQQRQATGAYVLDDQNAVAAAAAAGFMFSGYQQHPQAAAFSMPPTPMAEFIGQHAYTSFPMQMQMMPIPSPATVATSSEYPVTPISITGSGCDSSGSSAHSSPRTVAKPMSTSTYNTCSSPVSVESTSVESTIVTPSSISTSSAGPTVSSCPTPAEPASPPTINTDLATKSILEMVLQYDIPASLLDSSSFKTFCQALNPQADDTLLSTIKSAVASATTEGTSVTTLPSSFNYTYQPSSTWTSADASGMMATGADGTTSDLMVDTFGGEELFW